MRIEAGTLVAPGFIHHLKVEDWLCAYVLARRHRPIQTVRIRGIIYCQVSELVFVAQSRTRSEREIWSNLLKTVS